MQQETIKTSQALQEAFDFLNQRLFDGVLPNAVVIIHRHQKAYGYFRPNAFAASQTGEVLHEIALNPDTFKDRSPLEILSTLAHEQAHFWQQEFGKPSRGGYHNKEWGRKMVDIGLMPSSTGAEGGKKTGQKVSHYIIDGGAFHAAAQELVDGGFVLPLFGMPAPAIKRPQSKVKYACEPCGVNAWAKPDTLLVCGQCGNQLTAA